MKKIKMFLRLTQDEYGLILDFDTSAKLLAERQGVSYKTIYSYIDQHQRGEINEYPRYATVTFYDD